MMLSKRKRTVLTFLSDRPGEVSLGAGLQITSTAFPANARFLPYTRDGPGMNRPWRSVASPPRRKASS
jgi:hypothetical protein